MTSRHHLGRPELDRGHVGEHHLEIDDAVGDGHARIVPEDLGGQREVDAVVHMPAVDGLSRRIEYSPVGDEMAVGPDEGLREPYHRLPHEHVAEDALALEQAQVDCLAVGVVGLRRRRVFAQALDTGPQRRDLIRLEHVGQVDPTLAVELLDGGRGSGRRQGLSGHTSSSSASQVLAVLAGDLQRGFARLHGNRGAGAGENESLGSFHLSLVGGAVQRRAPRRRARVDPGIAVFPCSPLPLILTSGSAPCFMSICGRSRWPLKAGQ